MQSKDYQKNSLLRCPFCGGEAKVAHEYTEEWKLAYVMCFRCGCSTPSAISEDTVIQIWNTRKPMERIVEKLEQQKQQYKRRSEEAMHVLQGEHFFGKMCSYDHAIKIVKGGGVDETD